MLFNSFSFIFLFLPLVFWLFYSARKYSLSASHVILILISLLFYSFLDLAHLPILVVSVGINYALGMVLIQKIDRLQKTLIWLIVGICFNLALLGGYKYSVFFTHLLGIEIESVVAPLGISFFTFHQLAYLIDIHRKRIRPTGIRDYFLYVTFFPHLIAGPIMRYAQFAPQLRSSSDTIMYKVAIFYFSVGLFKKTVLADSFASIADRVFAISPYGNSLTSIDAWKGALAYTWQIYFDFSGYADMAIGLGLLFGIALPVNFISPYKATSMADFWRRWHVTLSQFLRDYIYIPLGGSRHGKIRQILALIATMALAGLWHGAAWTFIIWGILHGGLIGIVHIWRGSFGRYITLPNWMGVVLTFSTVVVLWVLFRSENWAGAMNYYKAMCEMPSFSFPNHMSAWLSDPAWSEWLWIIFGGLIVFILKPSAYWVGYDHESPSVDRLKVNLWHGVASGILLWMAFKTMSTEPSRSFVYFVF